MHGLRYVNRCTPCSAAFNQVYSTSCKSIGLGIYHMDFVTAVFPSLVEGEILIEISDRLQLVNKNHDPATYAIETTFCLKSGSENVPRSDRTGSERYCF